MTNAQHVTGCSLEQLLHGPRDKRVWCMISWSTKHVFSHSVCKVYTFHEQRQRMKAVSLAQEEAILTGAWSFFADLDARLQEAKGLVNGRVSVKT